MVRMLRYKGNFSGGTGKHRFPRIPGLDRTRSRFMEGSVCQRSLICSCCLHPTPRALSSDSSQWSGLLHHAHLSISLGIFCSHLGSTCLSGATPAADFIGCWLASHWLPVVRCSLPSNQLWPWWPYLRNCLGLPPWGRCLYLCVCGGEVGRTPFRGSVKARILGLSSTPPGFQPVNQVPGQSSKPPRLPHPDHLFSSSPGTHTSLCMVLILL